MTIDEMRAVLTANYYNDFSEAAKQFNTTRTALVRDIHNAEGKIGGPLFEKNDLSKRYTLTPLGHRVIPCLQEIVQTYNEMTEIIEKLQEQVENRLTIGISSPSQNNPDTIRLLTALVRKHPQIEISNLIRQSCVLEQMLFARQVDCAFFTYMDNETPGFNVEHVIGDSSVEAVTISHSQNMYIAVSEKHPFAKRTEITMSDLRGETLFFNHELCSERYDKPRVREFFANSGENMENYNIQYIDFINSDFLLRLVARGDGMLPRVYTQPSQGVAYVPLKDFTTNYTTVMVAHRMIVNPNKQLFLDTAKKLAISVQQGHA